VSLTGGLKDTRISLIREDSIESQLVYEENSIDTNMVISGNGYIEDGKVYVNIVCGLNGDKAIAGQLIEGKTISCIRAGILIG